MNLIVDRDEIARFVEALFRNADLDTFVAMRSFFDAKDGVALYEEWRTVRNTGNLDDLVDAAEDLAALCAIEDDPVCFAPPLCTFATRDKADASNVSNGIVISAELDSAPATGRERLEAVLGPATIVMESGGLWSNADTGEAIPKLHLHWRLAKPTRYAIDHNDLREANRLATEIAGGDPSGVPLVHPLRWAGSWHRKAEPRLARIIAYNPEVEIDWREALEKLRAAKPNGKDHHPHSSVGAAPQAELLDVCAAVAVIPNADSGPGSWEQWNTMGLRLYAATGGSAAGLVLFLDWSRRSAKFDEATTRERWRHFGSSPPDHTGAGSLFHLARQHWPDFVRPSEYRLGAERDASQAAAEAGEQPPPPGEAPRAPGADDETPPDWGGPEADQSWPYLEAEAFQGLAGKVVDAIAPNTEADPAAILITFLVEFGNAFGRHAWCIADGARHYPNEYAVIAGDSSKARKGTTARRVEEITGPAAEDWRDNCFASGLSSGEGIIHAVRDEIVVQEKVSQGKSKPPTYEEVKKPGVADKRLLIHEPEFAGVLAVMRREGSILSRVIREAFDSGSIRTLIKNSPEKATGAHISIIGHITIEEYRHALDRTSMVNGYANRFLIVLARRSQELPFGGSLDERVVLGLADRIREAIDNHPLHREITFHPAARKLWAETYHALSAAQPGLFGAIVARAEAHTLRLALIYALLDGAREIHPEHLRAALALWRYCEASAKYIFGDAIGDPLADEILRTLRMAGPDGLNRSEIYDCLGRHKPGDDIAAALALLARHGKARRTRKPSGSTRGGRPVEIWKAV